MRVFGTVFVSALLTSVVACQSPAPASAPAAAAATAKPTGELAQLMRGILFPNSNIIFDAQSNDPGAEKKAGAGDGGASAKFANVYTGWQMVEGAAVALAETPDLILKPGRLCSNGKPVPVEREDFKKFAELLRQAGVETLEAAKAKSQDKVIEVTDKVADACAQCHEVYRDKGPAGSPERCTP
jgi:hypothetical protein